MSLVRSFLTVSGFTLLSRLLGFVRDVLVAAIMGAGPLAEAFLVAFKLPNFFRRLFAEGAFNPAFLPMFTGELTEGGKEQARVFAEKVLAILLTALLLFTFIVEICMPMVMLVLAPGFVGDQEKFDLAVLLTRITFPYLLFISLVSLCAGILNSLGKFAAVAATPILLNCCMIASLLWLSAFTETPAHALAYGVTVAGVVQFIWLYIACVRNGITLRVRMPRLLPEVRAFLRRMAPGVLGAGVVQINLWVDIIIGTFIPGAVAYLYYADRISYLPLSIIGTAMGTALLPMLSKKVKEQKEHEVDDTLNKALSLVLFLALPSMGAFIVIAQPLVSVLFERGEFDALAAQATAYALMAYAIGLPAFVMAKIFAPVFFASGDTKTPVKFAIICLVANVVMNVGFVMSFMQLGIMPHIGLALATSLSSWLNVALLGGTLLKQGRFHISASLRYHVGKGVMAMCVMCAVLYGVNLLIQPWWHEGGMQKIAAFLLLACAGAASFFLSAYLFKTFRKDELMALLRHR